MRKQSENGKSVETADVTAFSEVAGWFDVPSSWRWVRLENLGKIVGGGTPRSDNPKYFANDGIPWLTPADLTGFKGKRIARGRRCITRTGLENSSAQLLPPGTVLFSSRAPIGYVAIAAVQLATNQGFKSCIPFIKETNEFIYYFLLSAAKRIDCEASGTTFREVSGKMVDQIPVPLPPLAEQERIVTKVDELMVLCNRLEAQQIEQEVRRVALSRAAVARFDEAPTPANLSFLFHCSYSIAPIDLRKAILGLAVQGKLVPQNPDDESAEMLLSTLEHERENLRKMGEGRIPKSPSPLSNEDFPYDLPESWRWARIGQIASRIDYGTSEKADRDSSQVPVYRMGNINKGRLIDEDLKYVKPKIDGLPGLYLRSGDILFNRTNSYDLVGKTAIFKGKENSATFASYLIRIRLPISLLNADFFNLAMNSPYFRETQIEPEITQQCGQANFNGTKLANALVPVPPAAEQHRVVTKVNELVVLVDQLEGKLASSQAHSHELLNAIVDELLRPSAAVDEVSHNWRGDDSARVAIGCYVIQRLAQRRISSFLWVGSQGGRLRDHTILRLRCLNRLENVMVGSR